MLKYRNRHIFRLISIPVSLFFLTSCTLAENVPAIATLSPTTLPALSLKETSAMKFDITDFGAVHAPVNGDANEHLIFGNLPVTSLSPDTPTELAVFLGRWEGYSFAPPIKKTANTCSTYPNFWQGGKLYGWQHQYPVSDESPRCI